MDLNAVITWSALACASILAILSGLLYRRVRQAGQMTEALSRDLRLEQNKLRMLEVSHNSCSWLWELRDRTVVVGPNFKSLFTGSTRAAVNLKQAFREMVHPEDWTRLRSQASSLMVQPPGTPFVSEVRLCHETRQWVTVRLIGETGYEPSHDGAPFVVGTLTLVDEARDSHRKPSTATVRKSAVDTNEGICTWSHNGKRCYVSQQILAFLQIDPSADISSQDWWLRRVHEGDLQEAKALWKSVTEARGDFLKVELRVRGGDESYRWVLLRLNVIYEPRTGAITRLIGSATDTTDQRMTRELLEDRTEQLNTVFELSPGAFIVFDSAYRIRGVNSAIEQLLGISEERVMGWSEKRLLDYLSVIADPGQVGHEARSFTELLERLRGRGRPILVVNVDSQRRFLELDLLAGQSATLSQILFVRDVTKESLVDEMKSKFMSTAAHELRTPMTSILGFSEILASKRVHDPSLQEQCVESIHEQAKRMTEILDDLLDLAKLEAAGAMNFDLTRVELSSLVRSLVENYAPPEGRSRAKTDLFNAFVRADQAKAYRAMLNILSNAYKYSSHGDVSFSMALPDDAPGMVAVRIRDQGIGIARENQARLFERFYRVDSSSSVPGTGLGLSIVKEIMSNMKGDVHVESELGQGTQVTLLFLQDPDE